jgi:hypothetical protein
VEELWRAIVIIACAWAGAWLVGKGFTSSYRISDTDFVTRTEKIFGTLLVVLALVGLTLPSFKQTVTTAAQWTITVIAVGGAAIITVIFLVAAAHLHHERG